MSGIVGILHLDGAPVDRTLLEELTGTLSSRGPDASGICTEGAVGFGHTLLRTTWESEHERQPFTLDGQVWIVADARIDGRDDLIRELSPHYREPLQQVPDVELILRAFLQWGDDCLAHLIGDFAFAIWDGRNRRLFGARDHLGVKPFYYARTAGALIFSNTLGCVRLHPDVSGEPNEQAIADFLLCGQNQDQSTTFFQQIHRLPPAHSLVWSSAGWKVSRYWSIPVEDPVHYRRPGEYVDRFRSLLDTVVRDRLRTPRAAVYMSGGLDSTLLAAVAGKQIPQGLKAFTVFYRELIPDNERYYAELAAGFLDIPIACRAADDYGLYERWDELVGRFPEPRGSSAGALAADQLKDISAHSRVAFYGEGPDNLLHYEWRPYFSHLVKHGQFARLLSIIARSIVSQRYIPVLPGLFKQRAQAPAPLPLLPGWLNADFAHRLDLPARWLRLNQGQPQAISHKLRPGAYTSLLTPSWASIFEWSDPGVTGFPVELRHPYLDVRMIRFLLNMPALPWCRQKYLLRCAAKGLLPEEILARPKVPLRGHPEFEIARRYGVPKLPGGMIARYVDLSSVPVGIPHNVADFYVDIRPVNLGCWLNGCAVQLKGKRPQRRI